MAFGIDDAIAAGLKIIDKFIPDPAAKAKAESELRDALQKWDQGQLAVNEREAASASLFVAGWRPFVGWVCGGALAYQYIITPLACWVSAIAGYDMPTPPPLNEVLWQLLFGMLGMGGLRTFEKVKGVAK